MAYYNVSETDMDRAIELLNIAGIPYSFDDRGHITAPEVYEDEIEDLWCNEGIDYFDL